MRTIEVIFIIWLLLPIPVYLLSKFWHMYRIKKYPWVATARVTDINYRDKTVIYSYIYMDVEYSGFGAVSVWNITPEGEISIRYDPEKPGSSIIWHPTPTIVWIALGLFWLAAILGITFLCLLFGSLVIYGSYKVIQLPITRSTSRGVIVMLPFIMVGLMFIAFGIISIVASGFLSQNIFWSYWNHQIPLGP